MADDRPGPSCSRSNGDTNRSNKKKKKSSRRGKKSRTRNSNQRERRTEQTVHFIGEFPRSNDGPHDRSSQDAREYPEYANREVVSDWPQQHIPPSTFTPDQELLARMNTMEHEYHALREEYDHVRNALLCISSSSTNNLPGPEIQIYFKNDYIARRYRSDIEKFVTDLITREYETNHYDTVQSTPSFVLDIQSSQERDQSVPTYYTDYEAVLDSAKKNEDKKDDSKPSTSRGRCFNCSGDHNMSECTQPRNYNRIAQNKAARLSTPRLSRYHKGSLTSKGKPGILSEELRAALNLEPHQIPRYIYQMRVLGYPPGWSEEAVVRESGITVYGSNGTVALLDKTNGNQEAGPSNAGPSNSAEYNPTKFVKYPGFNYPLPPNLVDESDELGYPPLQQEHLHMFENLNVAKSSGMKPSRKRKAETIIVNKPAKSARLDEDMELEIVDEIVSDNDSNDFKPEFVPPLPPEGGIPKNVPPPPPPPEDNSSSAPFSPSLAPSPNTPSFTLTSATSKDTPCIVNSSTSSDNNSSPEFSCIDDSEGVENEVKGLSPVVIDLLEEPTSELEERSMSELLEMQKLFQEKLRNASDTNETQSEKDLDESSLPYSPPSIISVTAGSTNDESNISVELYNDESLSSNVPKKESLSTSLGTPLVTLHSSYRQLPTYENFNKDVSEHLMFENLPNSAGSYSRVKVVLERFRNRRNNLCDE